MSTSNDSRAVATRDHVLIEHMRLPARIGVYDYEKLGSQVLGVSLHIGLPKRLTGCSDDLGQTIDYAQVADAICRLALSRHFNLVEFLAEEICRVVLLEFGAPWVSVCIHKYGAISDVERVGVEITRSRVDMLTTDPQSAGRTGAAPAPVRVGTLD